MTPYYQDDFITIFQGDCISALKELSDGSVNCCVTSPPYYGLRDYGVDGQIGLEETPDEYVAKLVDVFREVRRVLRDDGTVWLNLGDSYCAQGNRSGNNGYNDGRANRHARFNAPTPAGLKPKDLIGIPWRVAFALQSDGWYLRQDIIWSKVNPMPESVTDRCTKAHEYIFLMSKSAKYYYDHEAIKEDAMPDASIRDRDTTKLNNCFGRSKMSGLKHNAYEKRNKRSVWTVTTKPYKGAHFATFPQDLIIPCILAGCPNGGLVLDPFGGSGTTGYVAREHGRKSILCELNAEYIELAKDRFMQEVFDFGALCGTVGGDGTTTDMFLDA